MPDLGYQDFTKNDHPAMAIPQQPNRNIRINYKRPANQGYNPPAKQPCYWNQQKVSLK